MGKLFNQSSNGMRGYKRGLYEGALRQAAIARWPGQIPANKVSDAPWAFWDFLPTAAELAGAKIPEECKTDGFSLVSHLKGGPAPEREYFYWELHEGKPIQAVRFGEGLVWKAVKNGPKAPVELYHLIQDPGEKENLAAKRPKLVAEALELMKESHGVNPHWPLTGRAPERVKGLLPQ
jgi:arylsulfatase A-like enzyme